MNQYITLLLFSLSLTVTSCGQDSKTNREVEITTNTTLDEAAVKSFSIDDYLKENQALDMLTDSIFHSLSDKQRVAQLIMPAAGKYGKPHETINGLIKDSLIGGILMLNGTVEQFTTWIKAFNQLNKSKTWTSPPINY